ncbi:MAG: putative rane protein [Verrucomicrobiales bacterium]|nr:putative rane protein [Verrucomicrobiales bacterium]
MEDLLGLKLEPHELGYLQVVLRALIVFVASLVIVRLGAKRFLGRKTAFDFILAFILGSMLSRAINGSAPFFPSLVGGLAVVLFHRWLAWLSFRFHAVGRLVKGSDSIVIADGELQHDAMERHLFTERDLLEDLRLKSHESPSEVKEARIERSGDLSVIPFEKSSKPQPTDTDKFS